MNRIEENVAHLNGWMDVRNQNGVGGDLSGNLCVAEEAACASLRGIGVIVFARHVDEMFRTRGKQWQVVELENSLSRVFRCGGYRACPLRAPTVSSIRIDKI
jgi:hypothetical protein